MGGEDKENDVFGGGSDVNSGAVKSGAAVAKVKSNGSAMDVGNDPVRLGGGMLTYKRRRNGKTANVAEDGIDWNVSEQKLVEKLPENSLDQANKKIPHHPTIPSGDCSLKQQRDIVLEQICQSIDIECSLQKCIQDALAFHPGSSSRTIGKESVQSWETGSKGTVQNGSVCNGLEHTTKCSVGMTCSASADDTNHDTITELCRGTLFEIIMSEQFAKLCSLLLGSGMKVENFFDLSDINSRMKEKAYESSPIQLHSDMQQIWSKLHKVGAEMIALAKCLSDKTMSSFHRQIGTSANGVSEDARTEFLSREYMHTEDLAEASGHNEARTCRHCGEKSDGGNGLVCDSCEEMYHLSCIEPSVKEIPTRSWYCTNCTAKGIGSPHENCVACERLNAPSSLSDRNREDDLLYTELGKSSSELAAVNNSGFQHCKICRTLVTNDEDYRICGHSFCSQKFYHVKCLTSKQLVSYGHCWYCPSCLCRTCLIDQDDDKIVLCDGCDHAYHIYCMHPPQMAIPRGKWFCRKCDTAIQRIRKAKRSFEVMQERYKKRGKLKCDEGLNKSGGVDMLLNAAQTLNYEENLAAMGLKAQ